VNKVLTNRSEPRGPSRLRIKEVEGSRGILHPLDLLLNVSYQPSYLSIYCPRHPDHLRGCPPSSTVPGLAGAYPTNQEVIGFIVDDRRTKYDCLH